MDLQPKPPQKQPGAPSTRPGTPTMDTLVPGDCGVEGRTGRPGDGKHVGSTRLNSHRARPQQNLKSIDDLTNTARQRRNTQETTRKTRSRCGQNLSQRRCKVCRCPTVLESEYKLKEPQGIRRTLQVLKPTGVLRSEWVLFVSPCGSLLRRNPQGIRRTCSRC